MRAQRGIALSLGLAAAILSVLPAVAQETAPEQAAEAPASAAAGAGATIDFAVAAEEATVGQRLDATLSVSLPVDAKLEPSILGPALGPFSVSDGSWSGPQADEDGTRRWTWTGRLAAYRTGEQVVPPIQLTVRRDDDSTFSAATEPVTVTIVSVLAPEEAESGEGELADLKPPASIPPDYGPLRTALGILLALLVVSLIAWWLHRRYAAKLAAAEVPSDPFHRTPPHVWVYGELQRLLEQRLAEQGQVVEFYSALSQILKRYLGGRYRVELLEQTTEELPGTLRQAGAPVETIHDAEDLLREADGVKFAKQQPGPERWKAAVETVYRIVDQTKPVDVEPAADAEPIDATQGAA